MVSRPSRNLRSVGLSAAAAALTAVSGTRLSVHARDWASPILERAKRSDGSGVGGGMKLLVKSTAVRSCTGVERVAHLGACKP